MKALICLGTIVSGLLLCAAPQVWGQTNAVGSGPYRVAERGQDYAVWQRTLPVTNRTGTISYHTNRYVELETGKHFMQNGRWAPSREEIQIAGNGAVATNGPHKVAFAANINSPVSVEVLTPDAQRLKLRPLGIAYYDFRAPTNETVLIAELKDSTGELIATNQVLYPDAFSNLTADVRYTYTKSGLEQDIILRQRPPLPEDYGFNPMSTRMLLLTEFISPPAAARAVTEVRRGWKRATVDRIVDFGRMKIGHGFAFGLGTGEGRERAVPVQKHWTVLDGRTFLIEEVSFRRIAPHLRDLQASLSTPHSGASLLASHARSRNLLLPPVRTPSSQPGARMRVASLSRQQGLVLDFPLQNSTDMTLQGDTTYVVSGNATVVLSGSTTIEGGAVVKYNRGSSVVLLEPVKCLSGPYRAAVFTAVDDDSIGAPVSGSTGHPTGWYANTALCLGAGGDLKYVNIRYAATGVYCNGYDYSISHAQFVSCGVGLHSETANFTNCNVLMCNVLTPYYGSYSDGRVEHLTCDQSNVLLEDGNFQYLDDCQGQPSATLTLVNSLTASITNGYTTIPGYESFLGAIPVTTDHVRNLPTGQGVFQTVGAGAYYLVDGSTNRAAGTTAIQPGLAADLKKMTTYPPIVYSNVAITTDTTLWPQAQRNTGLPDIGWHYNPIDYAVGNVSVYATLSLANGVAVAAFYGSNAACAMGIALQNGSALQSQGTALCHNNLVGYQCGQEQPMRWGTGTGIWPLVFASYAASVDLRFTDLAVPASGSWFSSPPILLLADFIAPVSGNIAIKDCRLSGGSLAVGDWYGGNSIALSLVNSVLERVDTYLWDQPGGPQLTGNLRNNLFRGGALNIANGQRDGWTATDNLFDGTTGYADYVFNSNNGYINNASFWFEFLSQGADVSPVSFEYTTGPLGNYYQPPSSPLIDRGSRSAADAGLYHYTTQTNIVNGAEVIEGTTTVDIGPHYVAVDSSGNPLDTNANGIPDYIEDVNGNGVCDNGETPWGLAITQHPQSRAVSEGQTATFTAIATGIAPISYQWSLNGQDIPGATQSSFTTGELDLSCSGRAYAVRASNTSGTLTSATATLTVLPCDPVAHPLAVDAWKTSCDDKFYIDVANNTGAPLASGRFDLYVYFDGVNRTFLRTLLPWAPTDTLANNHNHLFTFCSPDHSITNFDCAVVYLGSGACGASPKFRIVTRDELALLVKNTTRIANPCLECNNCGNDDPAWITPQARTECDQNRGIINCVPDPCGAWPKPLPTSSSAGGASAQLDNFYKASNPPQNVTLDGPKHGFKNVYAIKSWHGVLGPRSGIWGRVGAMQGDCSCGREPAHGLAVDTTKYLRVSGTETDILAEEYMGRSDGYTNTVSRESSVDRYTGKTINAESHIGTFVGAPQAIKEWHLADLPDTYCAAVSHYLQAVLGGGDYAPTNSESGAGTITPTFTSGERPSMEWDYEWSFSIGGVTKSGHNRGFVRLDLAAGTFSRNFDFYWRIDYDPSLDPPPYVLWKVQSESEDLSIAETQVTWSGRESATSLDARQDSTNSWSAVVTYSDPYTSEQVNADCDGLLAQWNLLDDVQYPWRDDGAVTRGPLVTYNERGSTAPSLAFGMVNIGTDPEPNWQPVQDASIPPWPSQSEGAILGAPLPVRGPTGEVYTNEPYFNFYHINWRYEETDVGHPQGFVASRGAASPFPNATQWLDDEQARIFPGGPFWAYGSKPVGNDHFNYGLKNPYVTDTDGNYEQGGYGPFLLKCKWAETLTPAAPPGSDFLFKQWNFNFRDFVDSYYYCRAAWNRNNIETSCPGMDPGAPVRYTPAIIDGGYNIGPGSYWISGMSCQPLHYDYDCCQPAIYVQPDPPAPYCTNGIFMPMPPAACDEQYGSLWMGRVDQRNTDPHSCDNYVANRNNGIPNSAACDPQIELDLVNHSGGTYEIFVAPLGFDYGGTPLPAVALAVDANRDGNITLDAEDQTTAGQPYRFWINNDYDGYCTDSRETTVQDDLNPAVHSDTANLSISCTRDLEDHTRLWINLQGWADKLKDGSLLLGLQWRYVSGLPGIRIFLASETDGGTLYLTDRNAAQQQVAAPFRSCIVDTLCGQSAVTGSLPFILPASVWANLGSQTVGHFLFDAVSRGRGQLLVSIYKSDGLTEVAEWSGVWLDLKDVKEMYERWTVGDGSDGSGSTQPADAAVISTDRLPPGVPPFQYLAIDPEAQTYVLFVHGFNVPPWEKDAFAETAFKRLYWQGYKGRFGAFQWPTTYTQHPIRDASALFDMGEYRGWQSSLGLEGLLRTLNSKYGNSVYVFAHSHGNVVVGEALRRIAQDGLGSLVNTYVASQAAVPGNCYDGGLSGDDLLPYPPLTLETANIYNNWLTPSSSAVVEKANFYNVNDWALSDLIWQLDEMMKPDQSAGTEPPYGYDGSPLDDPPRQDGFYGTVNTGAPLPHRLHLGTCSDVQDRYEITAFAAQPRSKALGGITSVGGFWPQDLWGLWPDDPFETDPQLFYKDHPWHSAQFRFTNMDQKAYWHALLNVFNLLPN